VGGLLLSGIVSGSAMMGVEIRRTSIDEVAAGEPLTIEYHVANTNRFMPAFGLTIAETVRPTSKRKRKGEHSGQWGHSIPRPITFVAHAPARGGARARAVVVPEHCGLLRLDWVTAVSSFPFGLVRKSSAMSRPATAVVLPRVVRIRPELIETLGSGGASGSVTTNRLGESEDFYGLREYREGESLRRIAWKPSARAGELLTRQFAAPSPRRLWIVLDVAGESDAVDDIERAVILAANAARQAHDAGFAVGLRVSGTPVTHAPRTGVSHLLNLLRDLALVEPRELDDRSAVGSDDTARNDAVMIVHAGAPREDLSAADTVLDATRADQYTLHEPAESQLPEPARRHQRRSSAIRHEVIP